MRSIQELKNECLARGISFETFKKKTDYEKALQVETDLEQIECMRAKDFKDLPEEIKNSIMNDKNWWAEEKLDGVRMKAHYDGKGFRLDGRAKSVITYIYTERTNNFPQFHNINLAQIPTGTVFDSELIMENEKIDTGSVITAGTLTSTTAVTTCEPERAVLIQEEYGFAIMKIYDIIRWGGNPVQTEFYRRREMLEAIFKEHDTIFNRTGIYLNDIERENTEQLYKKIVKAGGEGIMLKHRMGLYEGKKSKMMLKRKKVYSIDTFISGYIKANDNHAWKDLVGAFRVSIFDETGAQCEIGAVQPGTLEFRKEVTGIDGSLKKEYYGKVVEVLGREWTKGLRLRHCTLERWRPDKIKNECILDMTEIKQRWSR